MQETCSHPKPSKTNCVGNWTRRNHAWELSRWNLKARMTVLVKARSNLPDVMEQNIYHYQSPKPSNIPLMTDPISKSDKHIKK
jgi:hypothetical protein